MITKERLMKEYRTQTGIAEVLGISLQAVSQWEGGVPVFQQYRLKYDIDPTRFKDVEVGK
jgi:hypothetical protein